MVEAQACGTPVIAFGRGGALESVVGLPADRPTGVFFHEQSAESLLSAVVRFERNAGLFDPAHCPEETQNGSHPKNFKAAITDFVEARIPYSFVDQFVPLPSSARSNEPARGRQASVFDRGFVSVDRRVEAAGRMRREKSCAGEWRANAILSTVEGEPCDRRLMRKPEER